MSWFCQTEEAKEQLRICAENNCPDCEKCIWIFESYNAMTEYGTVIEPEPEPEISSNQKSTFTSIDIEDTTIGEVKEPSKTFDSYEEKVDYIIKKFNGRIIDE